MASFNYQAFKLFVLQLVVLSRDAVHIHIGFIVFLITALMSRRPSSSFWVLLPGFLLSLVMEALDLHDNPKMEYLEWGASIHDVVNTNILPLLVVIFLRLDKFKRAS